MGEMREASDPIMSAINHAHELCEVLNLIHDGITRIADLLEEQNDIAAKAYATPTPGRH